jgi:glutathione S-transferase
MKLFYAPNSPYARIVRVQAVETGLADRLATEVVTLRDPASALLPVNPVGKVPTLLTDDGHALCETRIICEYLDSLHDGAPFIEPGLDARQDEGLAFGMQEGISVWFRELRRPEHERSPGLIGVDRARTERCLAHLEPIVVARFGGDRATLARVAPGCALGFADALLPALSWRRGHPALAAWFDRFNARPSMQATLPAR